MLATIGSVDVGVVTTRSGHTHRSGRDEEDVMELDDVGEMTFARTRSQSRKVREQVMDEEAAYRAMEMNLGIGLGGPVDGIKIEVEKTSDAI